MILPILAMGRKREQFAEFLKSLYFYLSPCFSPYYINNKYIIVIEIMEKDQQELQRPDYVHIYPFRFVKPYPHVYRTFTKGRWIGKGLLATLLKEFKAYPPQYYENAILHGLINVNGKQVNCDYVLQNGDQVIHTSVRTQPPVLDIPIQVISQSEDFLIINKPPSIIVHTGGGHHYNTIQSLLKYQYGYKNLHVLHRLDKCTSGLLIFAKAKQNVILFHEESQKEIMKKMYFARVGGDVKWQEKVLSAYIECISHKDGIYKVIGQIQGKQAVIQKKQQPKQQKQQNNQLQKIEEPRIQKKQQVQAPKKNQKRKKAKEYENLKNNLEEQKDIKDSKTLFKKIWYDSQTDSTLLECYPVTGRTHQIRVHLQYLGHPILNDIAYGGRFVGNGILKYLQGKHEGLEVEEMGKPSKKWKPNEQFNLQQWDYTNRPWQILLHSYQYKFGGNTFTTNYPYWYDRDSIDKAAKQK